MPIRDGSKQFIGVDTVSSSRRNGFLSDMVNRTLRGEKNQTRPPFKQWNTYFYDSEDKEVFSYGAIKGCFFYRGTRRRTSSFVIIAVHDRLLAGRIAGSSIIFEKAILKGIDSTRQSAHFCKAENILVYQNGKDFPSYWLGDPAVEAKPIYMSSYVDSFPMMIGNLMVYAHGRIFLATENDLVYASDHLYSQGIALEQNEAVLKFKESTYPSSGDGFGAPSDMQGISGIAALKKSGLKEGYGEVIVLCQNGAFVIDPTPIRNEWTASNIQQTMFIGTGCSAYGSVVNIGDDLFYRDQESNVSTLKFAAQSNSSFESSSLSDEVSKYAGVDTTSLIKFSKSIFHDRRLLTTCGIEMSSSKLGGNHIYAKGMVALDFYEKQANYRWDGLWTGPRVVDCCSVFSDGVKSSCFASHDSDGVNRLYYLSKGSGDDESNGVKKSIVSFYTQKKLFHSTELSNVGQKLLTGHFIKYSDLSGEAEIESFFSESGNNRSYPFIKSASMSNDDCGEASKCKINLTFNRNGDIVTEDICGNNQRGYSFDVTTVIRGSLSIVFDYVSAEVSEDHTSTTKNCSIKKENYCNIGNLTFQYSL
jgi:hypothetical protein